MMLAAGLPLALHAQKDPRKPNVIIIMTDQQRADLCGREGFPMEITPFADRMAAQGAWFDKAYTPVAASVPARISFLTGRFPNATRVKSNHNVIDAVYEDDLFGAAKKAGYKTALVGKNHTYMTPAHADYWRPYFHVGQHAEDKSELARRFDEFLESTEYYAHLDPSPYGVEAQLPYRMVDDALQWIEQTGDDPFVMWLSFSEPHNPYQVCEPYYSMFAPENLPPTLTDASAIALKGDRYRILQEMMRLGHPGWEQNLQRLRGNYMGLIRMIDDQVARFVGRLRESGVYDNTLFIITADHGDYAGEYGLMKKGVGLSDVLSRVPFVCFGKGVAPETGRRDDHISLVDVFPTVCESIGVEIPVGVQGRSLKNMLAGAPYPQEEFRSVMAHDGYGGQYYTQRDGTDYEAEGAVRSDMKYYFGELNTWSQSGFMRMVRMGDWKLTYDMLGHGELYNMKKDPMEVENLYRKPRFRAQRETMLAELLKWDVATIDVLPLPRKFYLYKRNPHNYLFYRD